MYAHNPCMWLALFLAVTKSNPESPDPPFVRRVLLPPSSGSCVVVTVVCSVLLFLVGLVGGFAAGTLVGYCCARKPHPPGPSLPAPLYEDVEIATTHRQTQQELKMEDNVAYGHVK